MAKQKKQNNDKDTNAESGLQEELMQLKSQLARTLADYDNLVKRVERERQEIGKVASAGIVVKLLPVLDNLEAAQKHLQDQGLAIAIGEFTNMLKDEGLSVINPAVGDDFDEEEMEAIEVVAGERDNKVSEVTLTGWKFVDGTVVRHAKVKVSRMLN